MGPTWVLSAPGGPHIGPMNFAMRNARTHSVQTPYERTGRTACAAVYTPPMHHLTMLCTPRARHWVLCDWAEPRGTRWHALGAPQKRHGRRRAAVTSPCYGKCGEIICSLFSVFLCDPITLWEISNRRANAHVVTSSLIGWAHAKNDSCAKCIRAISNKGRVISVSNMKLNVIHPSLILQRVEWEYYSEV